MAIQLSSEDKRRIHQAVQDRYAQVPGNGLDQFGYPTGRAGLEALEYDPEMVKKLPERAVNLFVGVGNPFALGSVKEGDAVLDIGCGAGVDALCAATMVGPTGRVVGVDITREMLNEAKENRIASGLNNVCFEETSGHRLMFADGSFDAIISNGVINLIPDKPLVFGEMWRVLKPGGRLMVADLIRTGPAAADVESMIDDWTG